MKPSHAVKHAMGEGVDLSELPLAVLQGFHPAIGADVQACSPCAARSASLNVVGDTAPEQVRAQIARHKARLGTPP